MSVVVTRPQDRFRADVDGQDVVRQRARLPAHLYDKLHCPITGDKLTYSRDTHTLTGGALAYPVRNNVPLVLRGSALSDALRWQAAEQRGLKTRIRSMVPSPVSGERQRRYLTEFLSRRTPGDLVLNVGSAGWDLGPGVWNLDLLPFAGVDLCCDVHRLPFAAGQVDSIVCTGVLEHLADPVRVVAEFRRVLRPGGAVLCTVPFMQAYHADPEDYRRYTAAGLRQLFEAFSSSEVRPSHGVGSGLAWVGADALAAAFSFDHNRLHTALTLSLRWLFAPLRILDRLSEGSRFEHVACSALMIEAVR